MSKTITIKIPETLEKDLTNQANKQQISLEEIIVNLLSQSNNNQNQYDPITPLLGTIKTEINDIGENHDHYLGVNLIEEK